MLALFLLSLLYQPSRNDSLIFKETLTAAKEFQMKAEFDSAILLVNNRLLELGNMKNQYYRAKYNIKLGYLYGNLHKNDIALRYYREAMDLGNKLKNQELIGQGLLGIGGIYQLTERYDSSLYYYSESLPYLEDEGDSNNIQGLYANISWMMVQQGNRDSGIVQLKKILNARLKQNDFKKIILSSYNLGKAYTEAKDYDQALVYYKQCLNLAIDNSLIENISQSNRAIASTLNQLGKFEEAIEYFLKYDSSATYYLDQDYSDKILELETKYRTAEIERENEIKQVRIEAQEQRMTILYLIATFLALAILAIYLFNEQRKKIIRALAFQKEQESAKRIEDLLGSQELKSAYAMLAGQEKAHKRIAEELHDNLGSILVTLNMFADTLQKKTNPEDQRKLAEKISEVAQIANEATRKISHSLHSGVLKHFGLTTAIQELVDAISESDRLEVVSNVLIEQKLDSELSLNVYRIIQELVNNTLKHARASKINIDLNQIKDTITLIYEDNGVGFDQAKAAEGMGLSNLKTRVERLDGQITIESLIGKGTSTIIEIPLP